MFYFLFADLYHFIDKIVVAGPLYVNQYCCDIQTLKVLFFILILHSNHKH